VVHEDDCRIVRLQNGPDARSNEDPGQLAGSRA